MRSAALDAIMTTRSSTTVVKKYDVTLAVTISFPSFPCSHTTVGFIHITAVPPRARIASLSAIKA